MFLELTGQNVKLTDGIRRQISHKFNKLDQFSHMPTKVHVVLSVHKLEHKIQATMHLPQNDLHAVASSKDMYKTIDMVLHKLKTQLNKVKYKMTAHH